MITQQVTLARAGGNVKRYHTTPLVGEQTNAAHTFHALVLLDLLCEYPTLELTRAVLYHDVAEAVTGDTPYLAKRDNVVLKAGLDELERDVLVKHALPRTTELKPYEQAWWRFVDALECCFFTLDQKVLGGSTTDPFFWTGYEVAVALIPDLLYVRTDALSTLMGHLRDEAVRLGVRRPEPRPRHG